MAIVTGKDCALSVGGAQFEDVVNSFELAFDMQAAEYNTLTGPLAGPGTESGTLAITFAFDSGETSSLYDELWDAAEAGTPVAYVARVGKSTFSGNAVAARPNANATAGEVSEVSVEMSLDGMPTKGVYTPPGTAKSS